MENPFRRRKPNDHPVDGDPLDQSGEMPHERAALTDRRVPGSLYTAAEIFQQTKKIDVTDTSPEAKRAECAVAADMVRYLIHDGNGNIREQYKGIINPFDDDVTVLDQFSGWHEAQQHTRPEDIGS